MRKLIARSPAKLNLTFDILGIRPDGYHQVSSLMQTVDLADELSFEMSLAKELSITISAGDHAHDKFPLDETNLIARAARAYAAKLNGLQNVSIKVTVNKQIPIGAGLAGGSGNAAATLLALNYYFGHPLKARSMMELSGQLGADVPFCLEGGTCMASERGDQLTAVKTSSRLVFCIVKPRTLSISTAWAYRTYDQFKSLQKIEGFVAPDMESAVLGLQTGNLEQASSSFGNVLEPVIFHHYGQLKILKQWLLELGSWCSHLSGSGPAIYAVVPDLEMAHQLRGKFMDKLDRHGDAIGSAVDFYICSSHNHGAKVIGEY